MDIREEFPELKNCIYLNNAAVSLIPLRAKEALKYCLKEREYSGEKRMQIRNERETKLRKKIAELINASTEEICMVSNTSEGLNIIAQGLNLKQGDNVILLEYEFPGNIFPWLNLRRNGVDVRLIKSDYGKDPTNAILSAVDTHTKVITLSFVEWIDGFKFNLSKIGNFCSERNIIFVVDAIQGTGVMNLDVKSSKVSFLSSGGYKWLLSPTGTGFIYVNKNLLPLIEPKYLSYLSVDSNIENFDAESKLKADASRFRLGSISDTGISAMEKSIDLILETGIENIQTYVLNLTEYAAKRLKKKGYTIISNLNPENMSGILSFDGKNIKDKYEELINKNIIVSFRKKWIRISPHFYNNKEDIDKLIEVL